MYPDDHGALMHALRRRPDVEAEAILTHFRRRLARHGHTNLHTRRGKRILLTRRSPGCGRCWRPPPQVADRRSSEWDAFVDTQPAFANPDIVLDSVNTCCAISVEVQTKLQKLNEKTAHARDFMS
jgi:hypothetical protein